jgi:hypothetical protein
MGGSIILKVRLQPRAPRASISVCGDELKIKVKAAPIDDKANQECCKLLAELFEVPKSSVEILRGRSSRYKLIRIQISAERAMERLGLIGGADHVRTL